MGINGQLDAPATVPSEKQPPVLIQEEAGWAEEPRIDPSDRAVRSQVPNTDCAVRATETVVMCFK